jgi:integrase
VRGDPDEGAKNSEIRRVPIIAEMRELLERLRQERPDEPADARVMRVTQSELAMKAAEKKAGIAHLTHHDLRHLFATRCIESGVDIPTVSRWLGHKDGGALAMKVYGHLRNQHSASMAKLVNFAPTESNIIPLMEPKADPPKHGRNARRA